MSIKRFVPFVLMSILSVGVLTSCSQSTTVPETNVKTEPVTPMATKAVIAAPAGGLSAELQGKPVVVDIYASWCPACKNVAPTLEKLKKDYAGKANFVVLDVTNKDSTTKAVAKAKELGLDKFLTKNISQTGLIAIIDPATAQVLIEERDNAEIATYKKPLDAFIAKVK